MAVHTRSVLRWVKAGQLPAYQTGGGRWRIWPDALAAFMVERGMRVPPELSVGPARVAIVDDDQAYVQALVQTLTELAPAIEIRTAHDGLAAGLLLGTFRPDLLFLDRVMPGIDGFEVLARLRAQPELDGTCVVVVSGELTATARRRFLESGADRCLAKPVQQRELLQVLSDVLPPGSLDINGWQRRDGTTIEGEAR
jgi:excisionase family DNA binding protein